MCLYAAGCVLSDLADRELDARERPFRPILCGKLIDYFRDRGCRVVVLSECGITDVSLPIHLNRLLRALGHLELKMDLGREYLDFGRCRDFAVSDHQLAHVYVNEKRLKPALREYSQQVPGIEHILDEEAKRAYRLDHERSGDLVLISEKDAWFTYYYWEDNALRRRTLPEPSTFMPNPATTLANSSLIRHFPFPS